MGNFIELISQLPHPYIQHGMRMPRLQYLPCLLAVGQFMLIAVTWQLWIPQTEFPQVPLISIAGKIPRSVEWGLLIVLLASLIVMICPGRPVFRRSACLLMGLCSFGLICIDQHRLQPWAWQFLILSLVLATADDLMIPVIWRWLVVGIYGWSAWSKIDYGFCVQHGPFLLDGICKSFGFTNGTRVWPEVIRLAVAGAIPLVEVAVAVGLCWKQTRSLALSGAMMMHVALLLALGPLGHNHRPGVLIWNIFFLVQNWLLFSPRGSAYLVPERSNIEKARRFGNAFALTVVIAALVWPAFEPIGLCDHWPAWAVYAAKPERVTLFVHDDEISKLPDRLQPYLGLRLVLDDWYPFRLDRWSLDSVRVPIYPQDRFQIGVALGLFRDCGLKQIRIVVEESANRWTGKRVIREYDGIEAVEKLAGTFRCGARPR